MKVTQAYFKAQLLMGKSWAFIKQKNIHPEVRDHRKINPKVYKRM